MSYQLAKTHICVPPGSPSFGQPAQGFVIYIFQLPLTTRTAGAFLRVVMAGVVAVLVVVGVPHAEAPMGDVVPALATARAGAGADTVLVPAPALIFFPLPSFFAAAPVPTVCDCCCDGPKSPAGTSSTTGLAFNRSDCLSTLIALLASSCEMNVARAVQGKHSSVSRGSLGWLLQERRRGASSALMLEPISS